MMPDWLTWLLIGTALGFVLENGGLANPRKLTGVFLLRDFTVPQVMPTAILTAMGGMLVLSLLGFDTGKAFTPDTMYLGQAFGGFIFGVGFYLGGYCPGTSMVALGSGRLDALPFMAGMIAAWHAWDPIRKLDVLRPFFTKAPDARDTIPELVGLDPRVLAAGLFALGGAAILWLYRRSVRGAAPA
ncbi:MAG TPA: YeeE/YedE thiosulfate transporter family protein [Planctomycetota bacterium]|nr:YeeE/YedE thiosulfate transporter family protein [Planctomycetota bacterium]